MVLLKNILNFGLEDFNPKKRVDNHPSKKEVWDSLLSSEYIQGGWYIAEEVPSVVGTITRSLGDLYFLQRPNNSIIIGLRMNGFKPSQKVTGLFTYTNEYGIEKHYVVPLTRYDIYKYSLQAIPTVKYDNFVKVSFTAEEVVDNHIKYTGISEEEYVKDDVILVDSNSFLNE